MKKYLLILAFWLLASANVYAEFVTGGSGGSGGGVPSGPAGGDLSGTFPNPNVASVAHVTTGVLPAANGGAVTQNGTGAPTPVYLNPVVGASFEFPMNEGTGTTVHDISGNALNGTFCAGGQAPTWTTYGLQFNGSTSATNCVTTGITNFKTVIAQICPNTLIGNQLGNTVTTLFGTTGTTGLDLTTDPGFNSTTIYVNRAAIFPGVFGNPSANNTASNLSSITTPCATIAWVFGATDHIYVNGIEQQYLFQHSNASNTTSNAAYSIGWLNNNNGSAYNGTLNYLMGYSTALTQNQVINEDAYINYQVANRPGYPQYPLAGTNRSVSSQVNGIGDSLTLGFNGTGPWFNSTFISTNNTYTFNYLTSSRSGQYAIDTANFVTAQVGANIAPGGVKNYCHVWMGTNDMSTSTGSAAVPAANVWSYLVSIGNQVKAMGCTPIVSTMISRNGEDTAKNSLNTIIRANWQQSPFAALNDIAAFPGLGADGAFANPSVTCFNADGIHLNGPTGTGNCYGTMLGYAVVGFNVGRIINSMDGSTFDNPNKTASNAYVETVADNYLTQTPTAAATNQLIDCTGLTGRPYTIYNASGVFSITVSTTNSQTITGSAIIAPNGSGTFICMLTGPTTGGNFWQRTN